MKKICIIIPRYKETERQIFPLLSSIANQLDTDLSQLECIIVNDNPGHPLDISFFDILNLDIRQIMVEENRGSGVARQIGLDNTDSEYVMFCDADDILHNCCVLSTFFSELKAYPDTDYFSSKWVEELKNPNGEGMVYITHELENTWMHGKLIRRQLIVDNNIRFHDDLRVHEDTYFLALLADVAKNRRQLQIPTYVWRWNKDSITRKDNSLYTFNDFPAFIHSVALANKTRLESEQIEYYVAQLIIYCYFNLQRPEWLDPKVDKYKLQALKALHEEMKAFWHIYDKIDPAYIAQIYNEERSKNFNGLVELYSLDHFIQSIK